MASTASTDWLEALREACARDGQASVARRIGYSRTIVSRVLRGRYPSSTHRIAHAVRCLLMQPCIGCGGAGCAVCRAADWPAWFSPRSATPDQRKAVRAGRHPSHVPLAGPGDPGEGHACGDCKYRYERHFSRAYQKCRMAPGTTAATDIRLRWPACLSWAQGPRHPALGRIEKPEGGNHDQAHQA